MLSSAVCACESLPAHTAPRASDLRLFFPFDGNLCLQKDPSPIFRQKEALAPAQVVPRLQEYDALLLISSFEPRHRAIAETSLASKMADYLAAGRAILAYGPDYAENIRYVRSHEVGHAVISDDPGALCENLLDLAARPDYCEALGRKAFAFGKERHNRVLNRERLWRALHQAVDSRAPLLATRG